MPNDFLVVKWEDIENNLNDEDLETFYELLAKATNETAEKDYYVIDTEAPYAGMVKNIMKKGNKIKITREALLKELKELTFLEHDPEMSHAEAEEHLLNYINDDEITKLFEEIPKWYA